MHERNWREDMKLYAVTLELAMNVVASDEDEAVRIAARRARDEDSDSYAVLAVQEGVAATGWTNTCIPWGDDGPKQRCLGEWLRTISAAPSESAAGGGK